MLALHLGMRLGELLALDWSDIDFKDRRDRAGQEDRRSAARTLPLVAGTADILRPSRGVGPVFTTGAGRRLGGRQALKAWRLDRSRRARPPTLPRQPPYPAPLMPERGVPLGVSPRSWVTPHWRSRRTSTPGSAPTLACGLASSTRPSPKSTEPNSETSPAADRHRLLRLPDGLAREEQENGERKGRAERRPADAGPRLAPGLQVLDEAGISDKWPEQVWRCWNCDAKASSMRSTWLSPRTWPG